MAEKVKVVAVIGTTGVGKSKLALGLADSVDLEVEGELVSCDSLQVYSKVPILTNQPTEDELAAVPHHLVAHYDVNSTYPGIRTWVEEAGRAVDEIARKGKLPVVVGGTHYYSSALLFRPLPSPQLIQAVRDHPDTVAIDTSVLDGVDVESLGHGEALQLLQELDPEMASVLEADVRKIRSTLSALARYGDVRHSDVVRMQKTCPEEVAYDVLWLWPRAETEILDARIDARVDAMVHAGLLDELESLRSEPCVVNANGDHVTGALQAIGLKEFLPYLTMDETGDREAVLNACLEQHKAATRKYARSQTRFIMSNLVGKGAVVYPLDASDASAEGWTSNVLLPATELVARFLSGTPLPTSPLVPPKGGGDPLGALKASVCESCNKTLHNAHEYAQHVKSRSHRRRIKSLRKREERQEWEERKKRKGLDGGGGEVG